MWSATTYRPDPLITAGSAWARRKGIPNNAISAHRVGTDDTAPRYLIKFTSPAGGSHAIAGTWQEICDRAHLALKVNGTDIAVTDESGNDVTFDVPAFAA